MAVKRPGARRVRPRSDDVVAMATDQPWPTPPSTTPPGRASSGRKAPSKNTSAKPSSPSRRPKPRTVMPVDVERDQQVGEALVALALGVGAEQAEQVGAERAAGGPGLLAVEHPAAALVVAGGLAGERRPGRSRRWARSSPGTTGPRRRPCGGGCGPAARALPNSKMVGRQEEDAVLGDPLGPARPVVLLLEDQPLPPAGGPAAERLGPRHHGVAGVEQGALPVEVLGEALGRCRPTGSGRRGGSATPPARSRARPAPRRGRRPRRRSRSGPYGLRPSVSDAPSGPELAAAQPSQRRTVLGQEVVRGEPVPAQERPPGQGASACRWGGRRPCRRPRSPGRRRRRSARGCRAARRCRPRPGRHRCPGRWRPCPGAAPPP